MLTKEQFLNLANETDINKAVKTIKEVLDYHEVECNYFISSDSVYDFVLSDLKTYGWQSVWVLLSSLKENELQDEFYAIRYGELEKITKRVLKEVIEDIVENYEEEIF